jgi:hypothetical protein
MRIFLSGIEGQDLKTWEKIDPSYELGWVLTSYFYAQGLKAQQLDTIIDRSSLLMVDSGAHSFQKGKRVEWDDYTQRYGKWIEQHDSDKIVGYFEMDVDSILGYEKVLDMRRQLEEYSDKIIPVWHDSRGLDDFKSMCKAYSGKVVAISGFRGYDIKDEDFITYLRYAWDCGCRVHCLGMTRKSILNSVPFDYTDSSSWVQECIYGKTKDDGKLRRLHGNEITVARMYNFMKWKEIQEQYYEKWKGVSPFER